MPPNFNKLLSFALLVISLSGPAVCGAGVLGDLNSMFMSNASSSGVINTKDRTGVFGGSVNIRAPVQAVTLVSFDAPRLTAGCGGVDLYGGSFSFINGQELTAVFRQVAANAGGLAFKAAIKSISPSLDSLLSEFQSLMQNMNNLAKNSCSMAHSVVDVSERKIADAIDGEGNVAAVKDGMFSDAIASLKGWNADLAGYSKKQGEVNSKAGNSEAKAIQASGASSILGLAGISNIDGSADDASNPNSLNNKILLSLLGYEISGVSCLSANEAGQASTAPGSPANATGNLSCKGSATIKLDDLVKGGGPGSMRVATPLTLYKCLDPTGTPIVNGGFDPQICTRIQRENFVYSGVQGWVNTQLFGSSDFTAVTADSIVGRLNAGSDANLSSDQKIFIKQSGLPVISLLSKTSNPNSRVTIARRLSWYLSDCVSAGLGEALYRAANAVDSNNSHAISVEAKANIEALRHDYMAKQEACIKDTSVLHTAQELAAGATLTSTTR